MLNLNTPPDRLWQPFKLLYLPERPDAGWLHEDDPCWGLKEVIEGDRRMQLVQVMRGDERKEFAEDLGPASSFTTPTFSIPGGIRDPDTGRITIVLCVGRARELAEKIRDLPPTDSDHEFQETLHSSMLDLLRAEVEEGSYLERKKSTFGYKSQVVRSSA